MKNALCLLAVLAMAAVASNCVAGTLVYDQATGNVTLNPAGNPGEKIVNYVLKSNGAFLADAARVSRFGIPTFFTNTANEVSETDVTTVGSTTPIDLKKLLPSGLSLDALTNTFTQRTSVGTQGTGSNPLNIELIPIPEPATAGLAGLCLVGLALRRRSA